MAKRLIRLFGFPVHDAPGEAEAECALLQINGLVDAVLSEDVDTLMFGSTRTLRHWSAEGAAKSSKPPTHVSLYDVEDMKMRERGLDRDGMVLVAVMSGGDYIPEGIPGCGLKLACEAARAGFGTSLCRVRQSDVEALDRWKKSLSHELRTNESGFFRTKHAALTIPEEFPNFEALRHYTHPVVSPLSRILQLKETWWAGRINVLGLRSFAAETFDWTHRAGALKFVRVIAAPLLTHELLLRATQVSLSSALRSGEPLINKISGTRNHASVDGIKELRVSYTPIRIVQIPLEEESIEPTWINRDGLADWELPADEANEPVAAVPDDMKAFDPEAAATTWIPQAILRLAEPDAVAAWELTEKSKKQQVRQQPKSGGAATMADKQQPPRMGTLENWVQVIKPGSSQAVKQPLPPKPSPQPSKIAPASIPRSRITRPQTPGLRKPPRQQASLTNRSKPSKNGSETAAVKMAGLSDSPAVLSSHSVARTAKPKQVPETIVISSSPEVPPSTMAPRRLSACYSSSPTPKFVKPPSIASSPPAWSHHCESHAPPPRHGPHGKPTEQEVDQGVVCQPGAESPILEAFRSLRLDDEFSLSGPSRRRGPSAKRGHAVIIDLTGPDA